MKRPFVVLALLIHLFFTGCVDDKGENNLSNEEVQIVDENLFVIPKPDVLEKKEPSIEDIELHPQELIETRALEMEDLARKYRGKRFIAMYGRKNREIGTTNSIIERTIDSFPYTIDRSTMPINRERLITSDMRISAILEDEINSQIPGKFIAIVDKSILNYNGTKIILPAYTKFICQYDGTEHLNQTRLSVVCTRIIRPDGVTVFLANAQVSDAVGRSGLIGTVRASSFQKHGINFLISALTGALTLKNQQNKYSQIMNQYFMHEGIKLMKDLYKKEDYKPIMLIKSGSRIQILPDKDIFLVNE